MAQKGNDLFQDISDAYLSLIVNNTILQDHEKPPNSAGNPQNLAGFQQNPQSSKASKTQTSTTAYRPKFGRKRPTHTNQTAYRPNLGRKRPHLELLSQTRPTAYRVSLCSRESIALSYKTMKNRQIQPAIRRIWQDLNKTKSSNSLKKTQLKLRLTRPMRKRARTRQTRPTRKRVRTRQTRPIPKIVQNGPKHAIYRPISTNQLIATGQVNYW